MGVLELKENDFRLPSRGLAYDMDKCPLINGDSITIRPLTAGDLRYLAGTGGDVYRAYQGLLSRVIVAPENMDLDELLLDDLNALLFAVRIRSFGPEYDVKLQCQQCEKIQTKELSLYDVKSRNAEDIANEGKRV